MDDEFECRYEVDDGYAGQSRPQRFSVSKDDLDACMDEGDLRTLFSEEMEGHFERNIYPGEVNMDAFLAWGKEVLDSIKD